MSAVVTTPEDDKTKLQKAIEDRWAVEAKLDVSERAREKAERELALLKSSISPVLDDKENGIERLSFSALEEFFSALKSLRKMCEGTYRSDDACATLVDAYGALQYVKLGAAIETLTHIDPLLEALHQIDALGYLKDDNDYTSGKINRTTIVEFIALEIVRRTSGLPDKSKIESDGAR